MDNNQEKAFWDAIKAFNELGVLRHVMVIGSWAEYLYKGIFETDYEPNIKTRDVDLYYWNIHEPTEKVTGFVTQMAEKGFAYQEDYNTGVGRFYKEDIIELEFLTHVKGSQLEVPYKIDALNIKADSLRVIGLLSEYPRIISKNGYDICVPEPAVFIMQKILALPDRVPNYKKEKDVDAIRELLEHIGKKPEQKELLKEIYNRCMMNKKQAKIIEKVISEEKLNLGL